MTMTPTTSTNRVTRNNRPWTLARAAAAEQWAWTHPQDVRGVSERILRDALGDVDAERLMRSASAAAATRAANRVRPGRR